MCHGMAAKISPHPRWQYHEAPKSATGKINIRLAFTKKD
jgi:hypothetical protein